MKKFFPSTMFSGEIIISDKGYDSEEEAKAHTNDVFPDIDWEEYDEKGRFICSSYQCFS